MVTTVGVRPHRPERSASHSEGVNEIVRAYVHADCDGLLVSSLSHDGIPIPPQHLCREIRRVARLRLAVIDAAQEFAHIPMDLSGGECDLYFAGCHKWLGAYQPLGIAILPNLETANDLLAEFVHDDTGIDDPLFTFLGGVEGHLSPQVVETVNLAPLFSAWGALLDFHRCNPSGQRRFRSRLANARRAEVIARSRGWKAMHRPNSGILMLNSEDARVGRLSAEALQRRLAAAGVVATAYEGGSVRLSLPDGSLSKHNWRLLDAALGKAGDGLDAGTLATSGVTQPRNRHCLRNAKPAGRVRASA
jgi:hypothetical protein